MRSRDPKINRVNSLSVLTLSNNINMLKMFFFFLSLLCHGVTECVGVELGEGVVIREDEGHLIDSLASCRNLIERRLHFPPRRPFFLLCPGVLIGLETPFSTGKGGA